MGQQINAPKGTNDILPEQIPIWEKIETRAKETCKHFGFKQIRTPEFELTALFERGVGGTTDIVQKEMYQVGHKGKENFSLKPEGTAPVVRAFIEHGMASDPQPVKLFYLTRCFRSENPQKGRYRQFNQFGVEALGSASPAMDAEVISLADGFIRSLGITDVTLSINSVGCPTCRSAYYEKLKEFLKDKVDLLCDDCKGRYEKNPMRIIDCKNESCKAVIQGVPLMLDNLCEECADHFEGVKGYLNAAEIPYVIDPNIVRGLDYYTNTAFEFVTTQLGAQATVCGGGRYNGLVKELGGADVPGIGFGMGIERLILLMEAQNIVIAEQETTDLYIAPLGEEAKPIAFRYATLLRKNGVTVQTDTMDRSLKAQMKYADKIGAKYVLMIGEEELNAQAGLLRDMTTKEQSALAFDEILTKFRQEGNTK
ncbi:MAG: histidine--tRNA ligase [Anaerofustis sp.]